MIQMAMLKLAWQQLLSQWKSGDLRVMLLALVLAVTSITAVNFFINRIASHLNAQGGLLLGGDVVIISDHAIPQSYQDLAQQYGLQVTSTLEFPSMVIAGEASQLAEIKALNKGFPLRGDFGVQVANKAEPKIFTNGPQTGEVWVEPRLVNTLKLKIGDSIELGAAPFKITGILMREPSRGGDMFSFAPRLMMHADDIAATKLIQFGSRVKYQLLLAGDTDKIAQFSDAVTPNLQRGERIEDVKTARPEIKSALDKAETFLSLSAFASVILSIVAILLASMPYIARCTDMAALMRCFGASKAQIQNLLLMQTAFLALIGGALGSVFGFALQHVLAMIAGKLFLENLPAPNMLPVFMGFGLAFAILFSIMLPHIHALKNVPTMRILRQDDAQKPATIWLKYTPIIVVTVLLMLVLAKTLQLALVFIAGIVGLCLVAGLLAFALAKLLRQWSVKLATRSATGHSVSLGLANLNRRLGLSIAQIIGFSLGAMVLMLLVMIKTDLMQSWRASLPVDAPNRFMINIQPEQVAATKVFLNGAGVSTPQVFPMIRGRLVAKNNQIITPDMFADERAKRLVSREFNLSSAAQMQADNKLLQGRWWTADEPNKALVSIEEDIAKTLNVQLNDQLTYDIAGSQITLTVASIRKVEWDSMRANFFAVTPLGTLKDYPTSYMTAFYLPKNQDSALNQLVQQFPNVTVIDVASLMNQVRDIMDKLTLAIGFVFMFCLIAGLIVLWAALIATRDSRLKESALLRVLGASRKQVSIAMLSEFFSIGLLAALVAILMASALTFYLSTFILDIPYQFNVSVALGVFVFALIAIPLAAWLVVRHALNVPPKQLLNSI